MKKKYVNSHIDAKELVDVKRTGDKVIISKKAFKNKKGRIQRINKNEYVNLKTGEVKNYKHNNDRYHNTISAKRTLSRLRDLINTNVGPNPKKCSFITLTYKDNMTNTIQAKKDGIKFIRTLNGEKMKQKYNYNSIEYILVNEPQGRGAYHLHIFLIFDREYVRIPQYKINEIWNKGLAYIEAIPDADNIGNYFCYEFGAMTLGEIRKSELSTKSLKKSTKKIIVGPRGGKKSKMVFKGARLLLMKNNTRFYSFSKGIKKPIKEYDIPYDIVREKYIDNNNSSLIDANSFLIVDDKNNYYNKITTEIYKISKINDKNQDFDLNL